MITQKLSLKLMKSIHWHIPIIAQHRKNSTWSFKDIPAATPRCEVMRQKTIYSRRRQISLEARGQSMSSSPVRRNQPSIMQQHNGRMPSAAKNKKIKS
jgi:hypothetical protein